MLDDDVIGAELNIISSDDDPVSRGGLTGEGQFVFGELDGRVQLNMPSHIKDDGPGPRLGFRTFSERSAPGIIQVCDVTDVASAASGGVHSFSLSPWKRRAVIVGAGSGRTSTKPLATGKFWRAISWTGEGASAAVIMVCTAMKEFGGTAFRNALALVVCAGGSGGTSPAGAAAAVVSTGFSCAVRNTGILGRLADTIIRLVTARRIAGERGDLRVGDTNIVDVFPGRVARKPQLFTEVLAAGGVGENHGTKIFSAITEFPFWMVVYGFTQVWAFHEIDFRGDIGRGLILRRLSDVLDRNGDIQWRFVDIRCAVG